MNFFENENNNENGEQNKNHEYHTVIMSNELFGGYKYKWPVYLDLNNNINDQKVYNDYKIVENYTMYTVCNKVFTKQ